VNPIVRFITLMTFRARRMLYYMFQFLRNPRVVPFMVVGVLFAGMAATSLFGGNRNSADIAARKEALYSEIISTTAQKTATPTEVLYSDFLKMVKGSEVHHAVVDESNNRVYFSIRSAEAAASSSPEAAMSPAGLRKQAEKFPFYTRPVKNTEVSSILSEGDVNFAGVKTSFGAAVSKVLVTMFMIWIPMLPFLFLLRSMMANRTGGSKKQAMKDSPNAPDITFKDVAGVDVPKMELMETVACLKDAGRYKKLNAKMPSGVLLSGPPGTGKTLLAKAVAGEAGVPFFAASASEFVELFVGRGAARVRELFAEARKRAPCVVFIDELDAVGMKRGFGNNEERDQTLNQLLTELDGFEGREGVLLLAATNRPEALDPALLRPGRLSRKVVVPLPDEIGRQAILNVHLREVPFDKEQDKDEAVAVIARLSNGFSGAELANVVNEAALLAARREADFVTLRDLINGVSRTRYGVQQRPAPAPGSIAARFQEWMEAQLTPPKKEVTSGRQLTG